MAALAAAMVGLYLLLSPGAPGDKDASEFTLVLATGGVLHPTGYPVYTVLGHGFVVALHAAGVSWARAANAWASVGGGVALFLYHRLALRLLPAGAGPGRFARFALAAFPALVLGLNPVWTAECTLVEVYSWHLAWVCGASLLLARLIGELDARGAALPGLGRRMAAWGLVCGLGGAHHTTAVFFAGGLTVALAWALVRARQFRWWVPLAWLGAGVVPLLSYGFLYYRATHPGGGVIFPTLEPSLRSVLEHVTARRYLQNLGGWNPQELEAAALRAYVYPFLWPGLVLLAGQCLTGRGFARRAVPGSLLGSAAAQLVFNYRYGVTDPTSYFLPCLAVALLALVPVGRAVLSRLRRHRLGPALAGLAAAAALALLALPCVRTAGETRQGLAEVEDRIHTMWTSIPYPRGIVLWPHGSYYRLKAYQLLQGEKTGLDVQATAVLCNDYPRELFRRRYGFDPLANNDAAHMAQPLKPEYVIGQQSSEVETHYFALVHETIAGRATVPVIAFDPPNRLWEFVRKPVRQGSP